jgi:hypothetical protein
MDETRCECGGVLRPRTAHTVECTGKPKGSGGGRALPPCGNVYAVGYVSAVAFTRAATQARRYEKAEGRATSGTERGVDRRG